VVGDVGLQRVCLWNNRSYNTTAFPISHTVVGRNFLVVKVNMSLDLDKIEQRAVIKFLTLEGTRPLEIEDRMKNVYGDSVPLITRVRKWPMLFRRGRLSLEDYTRSGCPSTVAVPDNIAVIEKMVTEDPRIKVDEIEKWIHISHGSIILILHYCLGMIKKCSRWIPKSLFQEQMRLRMEILKRNLSLINQDPERFWPRLITGDEIWISLYDPESRSECMDWHYVGFNPFTYSFLLSLIWSTHPIVQTWLQVTTSFFHISKKHLRCTRFESIEEVK